MANNKQRYVNTRLWTDSNIAILDPIEKLLFVYFITNGHTNISGIYEIPLKMVAVETGIEVSMLGKILPRLKDRVRYIGGMVVVKNFIKHQETGSVNIQTGILNCLKDLNPEFLKTIVTKGYYILPKYYCDTLSIPYIEGSNYLDSNLDSNLDLDLDDPTLKTSKEKADDKKRETDFNLFWEAYPKKKDKVTAKRRFMNLSAKLYPKIMEALELQKKSNQWQDYEFIPFPSTWLNQERWDDEVKASTVDPMEAYARELLKQFPSSNDTTAQFRFAKKYGNENLLKFKNLFNL
ncbi:MAG: hypothetical protein WC917_00295 [Bacilli bacterium]|jgi:hypothetical protein